MKYILILILITITLQVGLKHKTKCHPQCSWKCDDPHCPAICDPVCEPPKCHTSCAEPKNAICDVKCEKPECEIKCPDKGCEGLDCPKCVTVCKQPHCVTHCQAPKPECEPVCEEPKCDWKCHKPNCPKPKCELVCENPNCAPKVECCNCENGQIPIPSSFPFFKESETKKGCCPCNAENKGALFSSFKQVNPGDTVIASKNDGNIFLNENNNRRVGITINDFGKQVVKNTVITDTQLLEHPVAIGDSYYKSPEKEINQFEAKNKLPYIVGN